MCVCNIGLLCACCEGLPKGAKTWSPPFSSSNFLCGKTWQSLSPVRREVEELDVCGCVDLFTLCEVPFPSHPPSLVPEV